MGSFTSLFLGGIAAGLLLAACATKAPPERVTVKKLHPAQLQSAIENPQDLFFLDVRDPSEIRELGTLPGYVNIPIDQLERRLSEIPRDKTVITA
jgi:predicted sulfurtransferase